MFGVPGDFNPKALDYVELAGLHWVGNCNELNAAYAADGYSRIKGLGSLITTFGVGELSAANGIARAYAEKAPVVHIVGTPARAVQNARTPVHHTFADGDFRRFAAMHAHITVAQANITDPGTAVQQIDWVLQQALLHSRPIYLEIPDDMVSVPVEIRDSEKIQSGTLHSADFDKVLGEVLERIYSAQKSLLLIDGESRTCRILSQIEDLVKRTNWPTWTTTFGKGLINEQFPNVHGVCIGIYGDPEAKRYSESADLILLPCSHYTSSYRGEIFPRDCHCETVKPETLHHHLSISILDSVSSRPEAGAQLNLEPWVKELWSRRFGPSCYTKMMIRTPWPTDYCVI